MDEYERRDILRQLAEGRPVKVEEMRPMDDKPPMEEKARWAGVRGLDANASGD